MQQIIILVLVCLVGYRVVKRVRSNFSWSQLQTRRLMFRIGLFSAIGILFMSQSGFSTISVVSDVLGILVGAALGVAGAALTAFERRGTGLYFKANAWIGSVVTALFVGRLAYRGYEMATMSHEGGWSYSFNAGGSEWASGLLLIMFAYYVVYYTLLLKQGKQAAVRLN
ncbi:CcdC protein domain-containing protein [Paenibacillus sacheonensis]|uniref:DUF1453 family protein n=1 Tax=Paenibacillus sacheonensis TaxID=742054 RepID=A0A7X5C054_9BACL|nr:CcdC protein domain-containing protein [Paenibacillus sacheonensis]MBM7567508.1 hypothetical protein [Paenibacillus sacheonensis]NBC71387.1 DUF1453 family protein [Paenibacillus sacheonensis]